MADFLYSQVSECDVGLFQDREATLDVVFVDSNGCEWAQGCHKLYLENQGLFVRIDSCATGGRCLGKSMSSRFCNSCENVLGLF